jgi:hypothetical protein
MATALNERPAATTLAGGAVILAALLWNAVADVVARRPPRDAR